MKGITTEFDIKEIKDLYIMSKNDVDKFAESAALAYKDYPLFKYLTDNQNDYKIVKCIIASSLKAMNNQLLGLANNSEANAIAILVPPNYKGSKALPFLFGGGLKLFLISNFGIFLKLSNYEKHAMKLKKKYTDHKCWYLYNVTVKPEYQHQGMSSKILKPIFDYFDRTKQDCYLETHKEENVKLYEHFGFELLEISKIPKTDIVQYSMIRRYKH